jgi:lysozyme
MIPAPHGSSASMTTQTVSKPVYHTVRSGDTSSGIAKKYGVSRQSLMEANPRVDFGGGLIPGSRVVIPGKTTRVEVPKTTTSTTSSASGSYIVKPGDSLKAIAIKHGTTTANLAALNGIKDANKVVVGQRLVLPGGKATTSHSTASSSKSKSTPKTTPPPPMSSDTVPIPGMGLPPPPPGYGTAGASAPPATPPASKPASKPAAAPSDSHRGVLAYRVDNTDTIETIAGQFGTTPARIREINHLQPSTQLKNGDEIMVPAMAGVGN